MVEENSESKRNVSDEWIRNNVYEALETIELAERRMRNGCADLKEYIQEMSIGLHRIPEIQLMNMGIMLTEFDILIENTKKILKKDDYDDARKNIDLYLRYFHEKKVYKVLRNDQNIKVRKRIVLNKYFSKLAGDLSKLRSKMVDNLSHILFLKDKDKGSEEKGED